MLTIPYKNNILSISTIVVYNLCSIDEKNGIVKSISIKIDMNQMNRRRGTIVAYKINETKKKKCKHIKHSSSELQEHYPLNVERNALHLILFPRKSIDSVTSDNASTR